MKNFKLDNFIKDHAESVFPNYFSLDDVSAMEIASEIGRKINFNTQHDGLSLVIALDSLSEICPGVNARNENFNLINFISDANISSNEELFVNWYRYDDIDKFNLCDLDKYFDYIWYPDVDDIDIFDSSFDWIISITHTGQVKILKFK